MSKRELRLEPDTLYARDEARKKGKHPNLITKKLDRCFWCEMILLPSEKTRDHLHPIGQGGDVYGECVTSCEPCNLSRGRLTGYMKEITITLALLKWIKEGRKDPCPVYRRKYIEDSWVMNTYKTLIKKKPKMEELREYWKDKEIKKLGKCYVGNLEFNLAMEGNL